MYSATVLLRRSEAQFWRMTPKKLNVLMKVWIDINNKQQEQEESGPAYIDQLF